ncbi:MAG: hypothetical protein KA768_09480, partial [Desulfobulbus sp.]|nr:hypothetical protein [Desulfobulbus sp.]
NSPVHYPSQSQLDWTIIQFKTKYFLARSFTVQFSKINSCERLVRHAALVILAAFVFLVKRKIIPPAFFLPAQRW